VIHQPDTGRYIIRSNYSFSKHSAVENKELEEAICREILEAYGALFDLIKDDLVPYVTRRQKETLTKKNAKDMIRLSERMELTQSVYEKELKRRQQLLERFTQNHEKQMERLRESMVRLMITEKQ
jgi:DNA polymerase III delta prime subunit